MMELWTASHSFLGVFRKTPLLNDVATNTPRFSQAPGSRAQRCLWLLHELGREDDVALITMPFPPRVTFRPYLKVNILGTVPFFRDTAAPGVELTESVAICVFLAQRLGPTSLVVKPKEKDYPAYLNWLFHADATLTFPQTVVLRYSLQERGVADAAVEASPVASFCLSHSTRLLPTRVRASTSHPPHPHPCHSIQGYAKWYIARLRLLNRVLSDGRKFLCAERLTLADICVGLVSSTV